MRPNAARDALEAEIATILGRSIAEGQRHSAHKQLTGGTPTIWIEAVHDSYGWRVTAWENGLNAIARFATSEALTEIDAIRGALAAWGDGGDLRRADNVRPAPHRKGLTSTD